MIDELDLHLHPSVEQTILMRLRSTFTRMQWIVSTHSPLVLSAFEQKEGTNVIYKISVGKDGPRFSPVLNMCGVDASCRHPLRRGQGRMAHAHAEGTA